MRRGETCQEMGSVNPPLAKTSLRTRSFPLIASQQIYVLHLPMDTFTSLGGCRGFRGMVEAIGKPAGFIGKKSIKTEDVGALADTYRPSNFVAPPELVEFLAERKPVAIGFGSMPSPGSKRNFERETCFLVSCFEELVKQATDDPRCDLVNVTTFPSQLK